MMKRVVLILALLAGLAGFWNRASGGDAGPPTSMGATFSGGDGSNERSAVVIENAPNERAGIHAEHDWLQQHYPGSTMKRQALAQHGGRVFDVIEIRTLEGAQIKIWFDIASFFGNY
jgi:hypothetical protein